MYTQAVLISGHSGVSYHINDADVVRKSAWAISAMKPNMKTMALALPSKREAGVACHVSVLHNNPFYFILFYSPADGEK